MTDTDTETEGTDDGWVPSCYDCERELARRHLQPTEVIDTSGPGIGYERITVPMCGKCRKKRFGFSCPQCGVLHDTQEDAMFCCQRRPGEAPDCPECGRRMERLAWGYTAAGRPTCEFAVCEDCEVEWGKFTGWKKPDDEDTQENADDD